MMQIQWVMGFLMTAVFYIEHLGHIHETFK